MAAMQHIYPDEKQQNLIRNIYKRLSPKKNVYDSATVNHLFDLFYIEGEASIDECLCIIFHITKAAHDIAQKRETHIDPNEMDDLADKINTDIVFLTVKYQEMYNAFNAKCQRYST